MVQEYLILLNERDFVVGTNLYLALKRMRKAECARTLWIDAICINAICINQEDDLEKGIQVQIMDKVYSKARLVVVWLGEEEPADKLAFNLLHQWHERITSQEGAVYWLGEVWKNNYAELKSPGWAALAKLLKRRWFRRVWVIQEAVMASKAVILCGTLQISWDILEHVLCAFVDGPIIGLLQSNNAFFDTGLHGIEMSVKVKRIRGFLASGGEFMLLDLLSVTRMLEATDQRDRVFALISLIRPVEANRKLTTRCPSRSSSRKWIFLS